MDKKVYFITGVSQGLGYEMTKHFLKEGHIVAGTTRDISKIDTTLSTNTNFLALEIDLSNRKDIETSVNQVIRKFSRINVLINNAGYGLFGAIEELSQKEIENNYNINVFGLINVLSAVLPIMRKQRSGHIFNISSIGGFIGTFPGSGIYCSTKFAVAGLTEGLKADVEEFGIKVILVYPGYFRTNFLESTSMKAPSNEISDYKEAKKMVSTHQNDINQNQPGDPKKLAKMIYEVSLLDEVPFHLFLGSDSYSYAKNKIDTLEIELEKNKELSFSTDF
ncbi:SDR family NAD(P)-dependent oxidoreductase [Arcobacter sp. F2176]|uniref:SDR family NAD(P)-dependent oxidoreductase n=1 Tax=Arcobacter sp. F2176 TaxID=2044511 RepID=UPI00100B67D1|nr:SDR family NAD(P)-dependent oxidoreductase [Arcobacter sp. F2176]RXJ82388.1 short-chain dehydrogenase/reductase [Arcobacter sp. F2176]